MLIFLMSLDEIMEDQIQTSVRLPKELLKRAKKYAIDNDTSLAALLIESLEYYLDKKK
jgi:predicted DNA-binding protein